MNVQMDGVVIVQQAVKSLLDEEISSSEATMLMSLLARHLEENIRSNIQSIIENWISNSQEHVSWLLAHKVGNLNVPGGYLKTEIHVSVSENGGAILSR